MEKVAWLFDADFEKRLFSSQKLPFISTRENQEFEYLIHFLDPDKTIFTHKTYSKSYKEFLKKFNQKDFKTTNNRDFLIKPWCSPYTQTDILKVYQSKLEAYQILQRHGLLENNFSLIQKKENLKENKLYKFAKNSSGRGHYIFPRDKIRLEKLLDNNEVLIEEEIYQRVLDFSTLIKNGKAVKVYENIVDDHFQYRGTMISKDFKLNKEFEKKYQDVQSEIIKMLSDFKGVFSLDSFLYQKNEQIFLFPICEFNMRKTMGYIAYQLQQKYFKEQDYFALVLTRNRKESPQDHDSLTLLSPMDNLFYVYAAVAPSELELKKLISTLF